MIEDLQADLEQKYQTLLGSIAKQKNDTHDSVSHLREALKTKVSIDKLEESEERI